MVIEGLDSLVVAGLSYAGIKRASVRFRPGYPIIEPIVELNDRFPVVAGEILYRKNWPWRSRPFSDRIRWIGWYKHLDRRLPSLLKTYDAGRLAINLSTEQAADTTIFSMLRNSTYLNRLILEWTEDFCTRQSLLDKAGDHFHRLEQAGAQIVLDDAGSGHDWADRLRYAPISWIKIDGNLFQAAYENPAGVEGVMCRSMVRSAHQLGVKVVAEWIETPNHLHYAARIGCDMGQGWLFKKTP